MTHTKNNASKLRVNLAKNSKIPHYQEYGVDMEFHALTTVESFSSDCEDEYEYQFRHFDANTRHVAYAISYLP